MEVIEGSGGYYVVLFLDRYLDETPTADIRHILIKAELTQEDDAATSDVDESAVPTQEALDAAKAEAEDLLAQWESGERTAESVRRPGRSALRRYRLQYQRRPV